MQGMHEIGAKKVRDVHCQNGTFREPKQPKVSMGINCVLARQQLPHLPEIVCWKALCTNDNRRRLLSRYELWRNRLKVLAQDAELRCQRRGTVRDGSLQDLAQKILLQWKIVALVDAEKLRNGIIVVWLVEQRIARGKTEPSCKVRVVRNTVAKFLPPGDTSHILLLVASDNVSVAHLHGTGTCEKCMK